MNNILYLKFYRIIYVNISCSSREKFGVNYLILSLTEFPILADIKSSNARFPFLLLI